MNVFISIRRYAYAYSSSDCFCKTVICLHLPFGLTLTTKRQRLPATQYGLWNNMPFVVKLTICFQHSQSVMLLLVINGETLRTFLPSRYKPYSPRITIWACFRCTPRHATCLACRARRLLSSLAIVLLRYWLRFRFRLRRRCFLDVLQCLQRIASTILCPRR